MGNWGGDLAEFGKKRNTDHDFIPHYTWAENNKMKNEMENKIFKVFTHQKMTSRSLWYCRHCWILGVLINLCANFYNNYFNTENITIVNMIRSKKTMARWFLFFSSNWNEDAREARGNVQRSVLNYISDNKVF